jgi:hypothetical protein
VLAPRQVVGIGKRNVTTSENSKSSSLRLTVRAIIRSRKLLKSYLNTNSNGGCLGKAEIMRLGDSHIGVHQELYESRLELR